MQSEVNCEKWEVFQYFRNRKTPSGNLAVSCVIYGLSLISRSPVHLDLMCGNGPLGTRDVIRWTDRLSQ